MLTPDALLKELRAARDKAKERAIDLATRGSLVDLAQAAAEFHAAESALLAAEEMKAALETIGDSKS